METKEEIKIEQVAEAETTSTGDEQETVARLTPEWIVSVVTLLQNSSNIAVAEDTLSLAVATQRNLMVLINSLNTILNSLSQNITVYADDVAGWVREENGSLKVRQDKAEAPVTAAVENPPVEDAA